MSWEMLGPAALHLDPDKIRGGRPTITADDVRLALAGLGERPFLFGMAAFLGHRGSMEQIEVILTHDLVSLAQSSRWGSGKDARGEPTGELTTTEIFTVERMAKLMLFEVISARSRHDTYAHEEALPTGSASVLCPKCRGRGRSAYPTPPADLQHAEDELWLARTMGSLAVVRAAKRVVIAMRAAIDAEDCDLCHGRGRFLLANPKRAMMVGVSLRTWERKWSARYAEGLALPQAWEGIAIGHVHRRLLRDS